MCYGTTSVPFILYMHTYICITYISDCDEFRFRAAPAAERSERVAIRVYCWGDVRFFRLRKTLSRDSKVLLRHVHLTPSEWLNSKTATDNNLYNWILYAIVQFIRYLKSWNIYFCNTFRKHLKTQSSALNMLHSSLNSDTHIKITLSSPPTILL